MTKKDLILILADALTSVCEGLTVYDLMDYTGLPYVDCVTIDLLCDKLMRSYDDKSFNISKLLSDFNVEDKHYVPQSD